MKDQLYRAAAAEAATEADACEGCLDETGVLIVIITDHDMDHNRS